MTSAVRRQILTTPARSSRDAVSAHAGMLAYARYMHTLVTRLPAVSRAADAPVTAVQTGCPQALAWSAAAPDDTVSTDAASAFGEELAYDSFIAMLVPARRPLAKLASRVRALRWSTPAIASAVRRSLRAQQRWVSMPLSGLCADAQAWSANRMTTPDATSRFDRDAATALAGAGLAGFARVLTRYRTPLDDQLATRINRELKRIGSVETGYANRTLLRLIAALGIS